MYRISQTLKEIETYKCKTLIAKYWNICHFSPLDSLNLVSCFECKSISTWCVIVESKDLLYWKKKNTYSKSKAISRVHKARRKEKNGTSYEPMTSLISRYRSSIILPESLRQSHNVRRAEYNRYLSFDKL